MQKKSTNLKHCTLLTCHRGAEPLCTMQHMQCAQPQFNAVYLIDDAEEEHGLAQRDGLLVGANVVESEANQDGHHADLQLQWVQVESLFSAEWRARSECVGQQQQQQRQQY